MIILHHILNLLTDTDLFQTTFLDIFQETFEEVNCEFAPKWRWRSPFCDRFRILPPRLARRWEIWAIMNSWYLWSPKAIENSLPFTWRKSQWSESTGGLSILELWKVDKDYFWAIEISILIQFLVYGILMTMQALAINVVKVKNQKCSHWFLELRARNIVEIWVMIKHLYEPPNVCKIDLAVSWHVLKGNSETKLLTAHVLNNQLSRTEEPIWMAKVQKRNIQNHQVYFLVYWAIGDNNFLHILKLEISVERYKTNSIEYLLSEYFLWKAGII